jgi:hypothetical protein
LHSGLNCTRPFSMDHRVKPGGDEETGQDREGQTSDDAKLSGAAHARTVAYAPIADTHRSGLARAVRLAGIVPLLRQQAVPPGAHMLRRRPRGVPSEALVPQEGETQDAEAGMEQARSPHVAVVPPARRSPPPGPLRRSGRYAIWALCKFSPPPLHGTAFSGYVRADLCSLRAYLRAGHAPSGPAPASGPSRQPGPNQ